MTIEHLSETLSKVTLPARYIGGEMNMVKKELNGIDIRFLLFFPDVYEIGMSNLGLQILYFMLNERDDVYCERSFSPWTDMEAELRKDGVKLYSLETFTPLDEFDIIGVCLHFELCYTNVLNMLDLAGIPQYAAERGEEYPLIMAGGLCAYNPEPMADFVDCFYIGEGEERLNGFIDAFKEHKRNGGTKRQFLDEIAKFPSIYVPSCYDIKYKQDGTIDLFTSVLQDVPSIIRKAMCNDLSDMYRIDRQIIPLIEVVQGRVTQEVMRGCIRGCRFCQAGFVNRPRREVPKESAVETITKLLDDSGYDEISLMSLSTSDYSQLREIISRLSGKLRDDNITLSLPSLRVDNFSLELFESLSGMKKTSLTFAPEAGTQRLRDVINKNISEDDILRGVSVAFELGYDKIKLYFMSGLPAETDEDLRGIVELCEKVVEQYYKLPKERRKRAVSVSASTSCFVPKPHTPFQWDAQAKADDFVKKQQLLKKGITKKQLKYTYHDAKTAVVEGALSRGDRRVSAAIYGAFKLGAKFDGWSELFDFDLWRRAFDECGLDMEFYNNRERSYDEILPWEHISCGVSRGFLVAERERALGGDVTPNCDEGCSGCGVGCRPV